MRPFSEHAQNPLPFRDVFLPSVVSSFKLSDDLSITLYLLVNKKNIVEDFSFRFEGNYSSEFLAIFSFFSEIILGLEARSVLVMNWRELIEGPDQKFALMPLVFYRQLLKKLYYANADIVAPSKGELVCRCFGVMKEDLQSMLVHGEITSLMEATDATMAGAGCGSCQRDISNLINHFCDDLGWHFSHPENGRLTKSGNYPYIQNKTPAHWVVRIDEILKEEKIDAQICDLIGYDVYLKLKSPILVNEIEKILKDHTQVAFHIILN